MVVHIYNPSYAADVNRRTVVQAGPGTNASPYLKKKIITKTKKARNMA
jgi:hypothetical protein